MQLEPPTPWVGDAQRTSRRMYLDSDSSTLESIHARAETVGGDDEDELGAADEVGLYKLN
jgi:outer membrane protein insertion porin family